MRHPLITISLGALVVASVLHASAPAGWCSEPVVVNEGWEDAWAIQGDYGIDWAHAQGFETPSGDAITCDRVSLYLERTGTLTGNIEYAIATDSWGEPDTILWDTERSASSLPTSAGWYTITVSPPLTLSANTPYFIIMDWHAGGMGGSGYLEVYVNNDYPDGEHLTFVDNGASGYWAHKSDDMLFRVYGQIPDINCEDLSGYDYGTVLVDSCSSTRTWTVTNEGDATLTGYISLSGSNPSEFEITQGGGSFSLGAGASRTVRIRFCPTSPGTKYATLHITSNDPDEDPCYKTLVGNGLDPVPSICRSPSSLSPTCCQGQNASSQSFEVWNCGSGTLNYSISDNASWLSCSPSSGSSTGEYDTISVNYSTSGLSCGAYSATITITDPDADNSPKTIGVNLTVDCPSICRSPTSLAPECTEGQNAPSDNFSVWNCGCGTLSYSISDNGSWLSCSPGSGSSTGEHDTISVNYSTAGLTCGSYSATITINGNADNSPQTIAVNLTVQCQPSICYSPSSLTNDCNEGEDALDQYFDVWNCGSGTLSYSISDNASWLSCSPTSGTSTGEHDTITVNYTTASLSPGNYSATITITGNAGISPQTIPVSLMVIPSDAQWTILVYLAADNNLETFGIDDFLEMADVGSTDDVRIVVQFDRIAGHDDRYGDWTDTRRFLIEQGDTPASTPLEILGELDMGNPQTLIDFVVWGMAGFPADHYLLVLWDHGDGWRMRDGGMVKAVCQDETGGADWLTSADLFTALDSITNGGSEKLDMLGFDACLMAMVEVQYQVRQFADYMIASEETEPGMGWAYDDTLAVLVGTPSMSPASLGAQFVSDYISAGGDTLSTVNLSLLDELRSAISDLGAYLQDEGFEADIQQAVNDVETYHDPDIVDLYHLCTLLAQYIDDPGVDTRAQTVRTRVVNAVTSENHDDGHPNSHGISIYMPWLFYNSDYGDLLFAQDSSWDEFLAWFHRAGEPPILSACAGWPGGADPVEGDISTVFGFCVHYDDPDDTPPSVAQIVIDGQPYGMSGGGDDSDYMLSLSGAELGEGTHSYHFYFEDGQPQSTRLPATGEWEFEVTADCLLYDMNYDGFVSIIGDVVPFVDCVYFSDCYCPGAGCLCPGDCNDDGFLSIIGDVECFVDCVYFGDCSRQRGGHQEASDKREDEGDPVFTIGGAVYSDLDNPLLSGLGRVVVHVTALDGHAKTFCTATSSDLGLWHIEGLPAGKYTVKITASKQAFKYVEAGAPVGYNTITIDVNKENQAANQSIQFVATHQGEPEGPARTHAAQAGRRSASVPIWPKAVTSHDVFSGPTSADPTVLR